MMATTLVQNSTIIAVNNIGTSPANIITQGPRNSITFHNPGSVDIVVFPLTVLQNTPGGGSVALVPSTTVLGGGFRIFANGGDRTIDGQAASQGWQALSISGSNNPLTIMVTS